MKRIGSMVVGGLLSALGSSGIGAGLMVLQYHIDGGGGFLDFGPLLPALYGAIVGGFMGLVGGALLGALRLSVQSALTLGAAVGLGVAGFITVGESSALRVTIRVLLTLLYAGVYAAVVACRADTPDTRTRR